MKGKLLKLAVLLIIIFSLIISSCPELENNVYGEVTLSPSSLSYSAWYNFLYYEVYNESRYVHLDLSNIPVVGTYTANPGSAFFSHTHHGKTFNIFNALPWLTTDIYFSDAEKERIRIAKGKIISITLPRTATMIDYGAGPSASAFRDFTNLRSVRGEGIEIIGDYAFYGLKNLREVSFPYAGGGIGGISVPPEAHPTSDAQVTPANGYFEHIGTFAFAGCSSLTTINFPFARIIALGAFQDCTSLTEISDSAFSSVWRINNAAFKGCTKLTTVTFRSVTKIGIEAFANCTSLRTAKFLANPDRLPGFDAEFPDDYYPLQPFLDNPSTTTPVTYDSIIFNPRAFIGCTSLNELDVSNAWNVYFAAGSLASIGRSLTMRLFDHDDTYNADNRRSYGHPQTDDFLGHRSGGISETTRTIESITFILPPVSALSTTSRFLYYPDRSLGPPSSDAVAPINRDINTRYSGQVATSIVR